ncbi:hypothetical protein Tco_1474780 [Tanacetum coccineum]
MDPPGTFTPLYHHLVSNPPPPNLGHQGVASTQALINAVTAALPSPPLPPRLPSLYIPPHVDRRDDIPESEQPPRKRLYLSTLGSRYEVGESSTSRPTRGQRIDYGFVSTVDTEKRVQSFAALPPMSWIHRTCMLYVEMLRREPMLPEWLGSLDWIESGDLQSFQDHRDHVYALRDHLPAHQTQLQCRVVLSFRTTQAALLALQEASRGGRPQDRAQDSDHKMLLGMLTVTSNESWHLRPEEDQIPLLTTPTPKHGLQNPSSNAMTKLFCETPPMEMEATVRPGDKPRGNVQMLAALVFRDFMKCLTLNSRD